jgi:hypothetical protein
LHFTTSGLHISSGRAKKCGLFFGRGHVPTVFAVILQPDAVTTNVFVCCWVAITNENIRDEITFTAGGAYVIVAEGASRMPPPNNYGRSFSVLGGGFRGEN